jgi:acyl dehydratase
MPKPIRLIFGMGSVRFEGVRFAAYSNDHDPMHVHGFYAEVEVIVELRRDRTVLLADRNDAVRPRNGSKADVRHVLAVASKHFDELIALLEK